MGRGAFLKTSFNAGELSPLLDGRVDLAKYPQGCSLLSNFIPTVQGPIYHRPGTWFVDDLEGDDPVLVPFVYNRDQSYILAISSTIRVYADRGVVEASPGVPYTFGDDVWSEAPRRADGSSRLSFTQSGDVLFVCDAEGGLPLQKISRLGHADWTIEAASFDPPPVGPIIERTALHTVQVVDVFPYTPTAGADTIASAPDAGEYWIYASTPPCDVGSLGVVFFDLKGSGYNFPQWYAGMTIDNNRIISHAGRYYLHIDISEVADSTPPTHEYRTAEFGTAANLFYIGTGRFYFEILEWVNLLPAGIGIDWWMFRARRRKGFPGDDLSVDPFTASDASSDTFLLSRDGGVALIAESPDFDIGEFPDNVSIFRERLALSSNRNVFLSVAGDFASFRPNNGSGDIVADSAMALTLLAGDLSPVSWMAPSERLLLGSPGGERSIGEQNISNAFGPTNVRVDVTAANGSVDVGPALVGRDVLMLDRTGRRLIRSALTQDGQGFQNLSALADHFGLASPFVAMAWRESPTPVLFLASEAGELVGCTFDALQDVAAWHRHDVGGLVRDIAVVPSPDGTRDDLWLLVEREINGSTEVYLDVMPDDYRMGLTVGDARFQDCSAIYEGAPATVISGLDHLEGEAVSVLADGIVVPGLTVSGGSVTLTDPASRVVVGLYQPAQVRTMRLHLGADDGVNVGKRMRVSKVATRMVDTVNLSAGWRFDDMLRIDFRDGSMQMDVAVPGQSVERKWSFKGGYDGDGYVCIEQDQPLPATIIGVALEFEVNS